MLDSNFSIVNPLNQHGCWPDADFLHDWKKNKQQFSLIFWLEQPYNQKQTTWFVETSKLSFKKKKKKKSQKAMQQINRYHGEI